MKAAWLGRLLRGVHAGEAKLAWSSPAFRGVPETLRLTSGAFAPEGPIPRMYSGRGGAALYPLAVESISSRGKY